MDKLLFFIIDLCIWSILLVFGVSVSTLSESELRSRLVMSCAASLFVITPLLWNCWSVISLRHSQHPSLTLAKSIPMNFILFLCKSLCFFTSLHTSMQRTSPWLHLSHISYPNTLHLLDCLLLPSPHLALSGSLSVKRKYLSINLTSPPQII